VMCVWIFTIKFQLKGYPLLFHKYHMAK